MGHDVHGDPSDPEIHADVASGSRVDAEDAAWVMLVAEAYDLALRGRPGAGLALLDAVIQEVGEARDGPWAALIALTRARLHDARGEMGDGALAQAVLD